MSQSPAPLIVGWSVRLYRYLLRAYPHEFRAEYEAQMLDVFSELCYTCYRQRGWRGMVALWLVSLGDLARNAALEFVAPTRTASAPLRRYGIAYGVALGTLLAGYQLTSLFIAPAALLNNPLWRALPLGALLLCGLAGFSAARQMGLARSGLLCGAVAGGCAALLLAATMLVTALVASRNLGLVANEHAEYLRNVGSSRSLSFAQYELIEVVGGSLYCLALGLILGAALGAGAGLLGRRSASQRPELGRPL